VYWPTLLRSREVSISLVTRHASELFDRAVAPKSPRVRLDDYFVADVKTRFRVRKGIHSFVELNNITDEEYETVLGIPMPGFAAFAGFSIER
jgi:outer membrane cobalamin receptor